jgi:hypothetical protein
MSKLREVIESLLNLLDDFGINEEIVSISNENIVHRESLKTERTLAVLRKAKSALAEPLKNCEVGTPEEQIERFVSEVESGKLKLMGTIAEIIFTWENMQYESEVK